MDPKLTDTNEMYAFILAADETASPRRMPALIERINNRYEIWYYPKDELPPLSIAQYTYAAIPKCFGITDGTGLAASGILRLLKQPALSLTGQGVFIAVIDTGICYEDPAFLDADKKSRIFSMWDQTAKTREADGVLYGSVYTNSEINRALAAENPKSVVPETDHNGHGTFLASLAAGSASPTDDFVGAAPGAELLVVKLREAGTPLRTFYAISSDAPVFAENDIMAGIAFAEQTATREGRPLVLFLGLGTNHGSHTGSSPLCDYLNMIASGRHTAVIAAAGNEGNERHHCTGLAKSTLEPQNVEINVEADMEGLWVELWAFAPEQLAVCVQSPTGELAPGGMPYSGIDGTYRFLFEGTTLSIDYRDVGRTRRDQLIYLRFSDIKKGLWTIRVYARQVIHGRFHAWLPMRGMMKAECFFLESTVDTTITSPADAPLVMAVGGYNAVSGALYYESGRGPDASGLLRPDFVAPAVALRAKGLFGNYVTYTGTSGAAALTAGACAQVLEWAVVRKNAIGINSADLKNLLCRSAGRAQDNSYPSDAFGYGTLDVYAAFESLRG